MKTKISKHPQNVPGKYYIDEANCVGCLLCVSEAPNNFKEDDGYKALVYKQPDTALERQQCLDALRDCPTWAIHDDGEMHWDVSHRINANSSGERCLTVIAPRELCYNNEWASDSNIIVVLIHPQDTELPDFDHIFSFWPHRRENFLAFLTSHSETKRIEELQVIVHSKNANCYPLFSCETGSLKWSEPPDPGYHPYWMEQYVPTESQNINLPVVLLGGDIGITAFAAHVSSHRDVRPSLFIQLLNYGLIFAEEHIALEVAGHSSDFLRSSVCKSFERIFACYSRKDLKVVESVNSIISALGVGELRWDLKVLRSGDVWEQRLCEEIESADSFQLFWSENAKASRFVRNEWEFALQLQRSGFIKPVYWSEPMPRPPRALKHLNYSRVLL
ncbi:MAG TPA: ferredoxin [Pyrinomonadaceae bacterium]|nr:ferredoxin [Pyrinomonadaceae bacterium]